MAATVGSISIDLSTNAAKFSQGFKGAATTVDRESGRMAKSIAAIERSTRVAAVGVKAFIGGFVAQVGLDSFRSAIDRTTQAISRFDEIATNARTTGLTTETYQALGFAAKQANIEQEQLNSALLIFTKNAGLAQQGTGALFNGLAKLNPELLRNIINARDQEERLKAVADALANARDETERAAISNAVFGRSGVEISRLFENGAASIDKFKATARELGIIVPDDLLQRAGELDDKLDVLATVINTKLDSALVKLAPAIVEVVDAFGKLVDIATSAPDAVGAALDRISSAFQLLHDSIFGAEDNRSAVTQLTDDIAAADGKIIAVSDHLKELRKQLSEGYPVEVAIEEAEAALKILQGQATDLRAKLEEQIVINVDTSKAKAALEAFRRSEIEGFNLGNAGRLPTVTGSNLGRDRGPGTQIINGVGVTKFGSDDKQILKDISDSIDDGTESDAAGSERISDAVDKSASTTRTVGDLIDEALNTGFSNLNDTVETGSQAIQEAVREGFFKNFESLEAAIRTGIVNGIDDSLLGKQFTSTIRQPLTLPDFTNPDTGEKLSSYDQFRKLSTKGLVSAGRFAEGGSFTVPGGGMSGDRSLVTLMANEGEKVTVTPRNVADRPITLNYYAAAGESERTARQNARAMLETMRREEARA